MNSGMRQIALVALVGGAVACHHPGPVAGGTKMPEGTGTIAGIVSSAGGTSGLAGRKVTAIEVASNARYEATTGADGGYTIKVPMGHYRLELELKPGEALQVRPAEVHISRSDLDAGRNFIVVNGRRP